MLKNHLVSAYRNVIRSKLDSILNTSGLVVAATVASQAWSVATASPIHT